MKSSPCRVCILCVMNMIVTVSVISCDDQSPTAMECFHTELQTLQHYWSPVEVEFRKCLSWLDWSVSKLHKLTLLWSSFQTWARLQAHLSKKIVNSFHHFLLIIKCLKRSLQSREHSKSSPCVDISWELCFVRAAGYWDLEKWEYSILIWSDIDQTVNFAYLDTIG